MFGSKVLATLEGAGHEVELVARTRDAELAEAELIVADLDVVEPDQVAGRGVPVLGFYPHVDVEAKQRADEAGVDLVVPRSKMAREMPELVQRLLSPSP
jgi:hypothetical protein